jgi:uncharacterized protein YcfL
MNKLKSMYLTVCITTLFLSGCASQQQFEAIEQICIPNLERQAAMQAAEDVLGDMHFTIAKLDDRSGYIKTGPLTAAQWFEFWRSDNVGAFNAAEANLHSIRRTVELNIEQQDEKLCVGCEVNVQRLSIPEYEVTSSSQAYAMFSASKPSMQRLELRPEQKRAIVWVDLGRDTILETEILKRIEGKISR